MEIHKVLFSKKLQISYKNIKNIEFNLFLQENPAIIKKLSILPDYCAVCRFNS